MTDSDWRFWQFFRDRLGGRWIAGRCLCTVWFCFGVGWSLGICGAGGQGSASYNDARPDTPRSAAQELAEIHRRSFSRFLRDSRRTTLWLDDLLARWQRAQDSTEKTQYGFELCVWLEGELQRHEREELQRLYPQIWAGSHVQDRSFASVQLVELRHQLNQVAVVAFEQSLRNPSPEMWLNDLREIQRRLRATADDLNQLLGENTESTLSLQSAQLQQLQESAESSLAWSFYYEWLLTPTSQDVDTERLKHAKQIFMRLLGTTEPDMQPADWYRWFDPSRRGSNDGLLGLGLCLAAMNQADVASTCFVTLQRQGDARLSQQVILWHAQNLLKQQRWDDARLLVASYLQALRSRDPSSHTSLVETMLGWFHSEESSKLTNEPLSPNPPEQVAQWSWRLLELLVLRGQIDEAAALMSKYSIKNPGTGLAGQVLLLHSLLRGHPLQERSPQQLAQLSDRLRLWASVTEPTTNVKPPREVQRWAQQWLIQVLLASGDVVQAQEWMARFYAETPVEDGARRQAVAWDLAQTFEKSAGENWPAQRACIYWYREAANQPNLPQTAAAKIKARLWELATQPIAQTAYLRSILPMDEGYALARRQLIVVLYEEFRAAATGTARKTSTSKALEREVLEQLGMTSLNRTTDSEVVVAWQTELLQRLRDSSEHGQDSSSAALLAVWLQCIDPTVSENPWLKNAVLSASVRHAVTVPQERWGPWRPILYTAMVSWDDNPLLVEDPHLRRSILEYLLQGPLTSSQTQALMAVVVPQLRSQWESDWKLDEVAAIGSLPLKQDSTTIRLGELYRQWWNAIQADLPSGDERRWLEQIQLDYAELLWRIDEQVLAKEVLDSWKPSTNTTRWRRQMARILSHLNHPSSATAAEEIWRDLLTQFPAGSRDWFEAKYYLLQAMVSRDPSQAKLVFQQLRQLYPDFPAPWAAVLAQLADDNRW